LNKIWKREAAQMQAEAFKSKEKKSRDLLKGLHAMSDATRDKMLDAYLKQCKLKHALAFFQWRATYTSRSPVKL